MTAPTIFFVRHGQTDWNAERRLQGQRDIPLNQKGRAQAHRNGGVLSELIAEPSAFRLISSPLDRCRQTMEIILGHLGLPGQAYEVDPQLTEIGFGDWEGRSWPELHTDAPDALEQRARDAYNFRPPGQSESYADLSARVAPVLDAIDRDTIIVSHGGVSRAVRGHLLDLPQEETPELKVPQDKVMRIWNGTIAWF